MQVEIINPQGKVAYRRPHTHPDVLEALSTPGYSIRGAEPNGEPQVRSSECVLLLRETLKDLFLASSLLRTRIHTHGKTVMNFEDYKRHTTAMLKAEKVINEKQQNDRTERQPPTASVADTKDL